MDFLFLKETICVAVEYLWFLEYLHIVLLGVSESLNVFV